MATKKSGSGYEGIGGSEKKSGQGGFDQQKSGQQGGMDRERKIPPVTPEKHGSDTGGGLGGEKSGGNVGGDRGGNLENP